MSNLLYLWIISCAAPHSRLIKLHLKCCLPQARWQFFQGHQFCLWHLCYWILFSEGALFFFCLFFSQLPAVYRYFTPIWMDLPVFGWSRHSFAIEILNALLNIGLHQIFLMLNFYTTYKFLSNFLTPNFTVFHHVCIQSFPQRDMITAY